MIKNVFSVAKKEATNYSNVVTLTANTGISLNTSYQQAENSIKEILMSCYNMSPFANYDQLISAYRVYRDPNSWAVGVKCTPEYERLEKLPKNNKPILIGVTNIFANSATNTWWATYTIIDSDSIFCKIY